MTWRAKSARPYGGVHPEAGCEVHVARHRAAGHHRRHDEVVADGELVLDAVRLGVLGVVPQVDFESKILKQINTVQFRFKRSDPGAFNFGFIG